MAEPQRIGTAPLSRVIDQAIRKEISWLEARERLRELLVNEPELFVGVSPDAIEDLVLDDEPRSRTA